MSAPIVPAPPRVVLVVGASRGIGAGIARAFAAAGDHVVLAARDGAGLDRLSAAIAADGGSASVHRVDVTDEDSVEALLRHIRDRFGRLDAAVNNAGGAGRPPTPIHEWRAEEFRSTIALNLTGTFLAMRYEIPLMHERGGAIVNMSSTAGIQAVAGLAGYVAGKFGVEGLTRVAALDAAALGIRVNAIAPGPILTDRLAAAGSAAQAATAAAVPLGRLGSVDDIAAAAVWLCSPDSGFITGVTLIADGGRLAGTPAFRR